MSGNWIRNDGMPASQNETINVLTKYLAYWSHISELRQLSLMALSNMHWMRAGSSWDNSYLIYSLYCSSFGDSATSCWIYYIDYVLNHSSFYYKEYILYKSTDYCTLEKLKHIKGIKLYFDDKNIITLSNRFITKLLSSAQLPTLLRWQDGYESQTIVKTFHMRHIEGTTTYSII